MVRSLFSVPLRMAVRGLSRSPGTSALAILVLVLGIAAPVLFFSLLVGAIRPLPVPDGDRVVRVEVTQPTTGGSVPVHMADLDDLQGTAGLESLGAFRIIDGTLVDPGRSAIRVSSAELTPEVLPLLGVRPALGRWPTGQESDVGLLLGHRLWLDEYAADPGIIGREVRFNEEARVVVGVLPEGFGFPLNQNAWIPMPRVAPDEEPVELVGRLADGAGLEGATAEMAGRWARRDPVRDVAEQGGILEVDGFTGGRGERGEGVAFLGLVLVALALLVIACANVANLLLVRASERIRSLGVQSAVGAGRIHLSAQLFLEALILAGLGGLGGIALAWVGIDAIQRSLAEEHFGYFWMRMAVDGRVVAFTLALIGGTALVAGTLPIVRVLRTNLQGILKDGQGSDAMAGSGSWNRWFVTTQLALSCAALVAAGLTGRSLAQGRDFGRGIPAEEILLASMSPLDPADSLHVGWADRLAALTTRIETATGAGAVAMGIGAPGYFEPFARFEVVGREPVRDVDRLGAGWNAVTPAYFDLVDLDVIQGRGFGLSDRLGEEPVAVVSASFAADHLSDSPVLGERIRLPAVDPGWTFMVVGVAEDVDMGTTRAGAMGRVYLSLAQVPQSEVMALVRRPADVSALTPAVRAAVAGVDPDIPIWSVRTLADGHAYLVRIPRVMALIALAGGLAGLVVAATGLYALLSFRVRHRRRELGVRMALGADGRRLSYEVVRLAVRQILPAVLVGLLLAWIVAPILGVVVLTMNPRSPSTFIAVAVAFITVGLLAALIPARRAAAVEPAEVLRGD